MLERMGEGMTIGHNDCSCPACADDVGLLATSSTGSQNQLNVVKYNTKRERYCIHPQKSAAITLNKESKKASDDAILKLGDETINASSSEVHLGVDRNLKGKVDINARITDRKAHYVCPNGAGAYG